MFNTRADGPFGAIPGQAPRLIHGLRRRPRIDTSAFSRLTEMPRSIGELTPTMTSAIAGDAPIRHPEQIANGLGLTLDAERDLTAKAREWLDSNDPVAFRKSLFRSLRAFAPNDYMRRNVIARRAMQLWKSTREERAKYQRPDSQHAVIQKSDLRRKFRLTYARPQPLELLWVTRELDELTDVIDDSPIGWRDAALSKAAGHKYIKRVPTGRPKPKYRYYYRQPKGKGLTSSEDLVVGAKFRGKHGGLEGHFEVLGHAKKGVVRLKHDESGQVINVKEHDLHRMISSYHAKRTAAAQGKPAPKAPKKLKTVTMADLQNGEYGRIEGFGTVEKLEHQAAVSDSTKDYAIISQGAEADHVLVSRQHREVGDVREVVGEKTKLKLRSATGKGIDNVSAEFVLVEAADLVASHNPVALGNFPVRSDYPEGVQERRYHKIRAEQEKVDRIAKNMDPAILINTNPDAVNGAPVVDQNNAVIGGNGRTMAIQMAYQHYGAKADEMRSYLIANARKYGIAAADVRAMKRPALVRRIKVDPGPKNANLKLLGRRMNEALTQGLDPRSEEVAVAQFITENVCDSLVSSIEPGQSLGEFLHSNSSAGFVLALRQAGVIDEWNKAQYLEPAKGGGESKNLLNEAGRDRIERVMAARLIPNADILQKMNPTVRQMLALSTPSLIIAEQSGWKIAASLKLAVEADLAIRDGYEGSGGGAKALDGFLNQLETAGSGVELSKKIHADPTAMTLLHIIRGKMGVKMTPRDFRGFAARAVQDRADAGKAKETTASLFGALDPVTRLTPAKALDIEFGISPKNKSAKAAKEKAERDAAAAAKKLKQETRARYAAEKKRVAAESAGQGDLLAASDRRPMTLIKAMQGANRLMNRATWLTQYLVDAAIQHSTATSPSRVPMVNPTRIVREVMADVRSAVTKDSSYAKDLGAQPITENTIRGLVAALTAMSGIAVAKSQAEADLFKSDQLRLFGPHQSVMFAPKPAIQKPPPGYQPVAHSKHGGYFKLVGGKRVYWYPDTGLTHASKEPRVKETKAPPPDPALAARRQAEDAEAKEALEVVTATALEKRHASAVENLTAVRNVMPEKKAWKQAREDINSALMLHKRARNLSRRLINPGSGDPTTFEIVQRFSGEAAEVTAKALESYRAAMAKRGRKLVLRPEPKPEPSPAPDAPPTEAEAWQANAEAASEPPPKKPSKTFVAIKRAADWFGMPVEQAGPRSVAIGGAAAAYESTLGGRWNRVRGEGSRQIVSNGKAMKWLTERADAQRKLNEEAAARNTPERIAERKSAGEAAAAAAAASKKAATDERSRRHRDGLAVGGNTFAHRTEIRAAGGDWDAAAKVWLMPDSESAQAMRDLINPPIEVEPDEAPKEAPFEEWKREMFAIDEKVGRIRSEAAKEGKAVLGDYHARHQAAEDMFKDAKYADASAGLIRVEGERVGETDPTLRVYGGGQWFIIEPPDKQDRRVWTIRGNGADGDNWSHSNTTTGIGKDIPWSPELDTLLRGLDIEATKKTISAIEQRARDEVKEVSRTRPPDPRPSSERPSEKQINFALELSKRLEQDDYGSATTYGVDGMTEGMLRRMSRQEVSRIISIVKDEVDYYR